jgi:hypothetical protein
MDRKTKIILLAIIPLYIVIFAVGIYFTKLIIPAIAAIFLSSISCFLCIYFSGRMAPPSFFLSFATIAITSAAIIALYGVVYLEFGIYETKIEQNKNRKGEIMISDNKIDSTLSALYFSVVTWTTLGYGDIKPSPKSQIYAATEAILGLIHMGVFIGIFVAYLKND